MVTDGLPIFPGARALAPPAGDAVRLDAELIARAVAASRTSPRRRIVLPLHAAPDDPLQRMLNALQPDSYVRPHRHQGARAESVVVLQGRVGFVTFDDGGAVKESVAAGAGAEVAGLDIRFGVYHTFFALEPDTVVFEVKAGPYTPDGNKMFADWAPEEGTPGAGDYLLDLQKLFA